MQLAAYGWSSFRQGWWRTNLCQERAPGSVRCDQAVRKPRNVEPRGFVGLRSAGKTGTIRHRAVVKGLPRGKCGQRKRLQIRMSRTLLPTDFESLGQELTVNRFFMASSVQLSSRPRWQNEGLSGSKVVDLFQKRTPCQWASQRCRVLTHQTWLDISSDHQTPPPLYYEKEMSSPSVTLTPKEDDERSQVGRSGWSWVSAQTHPEDCHLSQLLIGYEWRH